MSDVSSKIASQLSASSPGSSLYLSSAQLCEESWGGRASRLDGLASGETFVSITRGRTGATEVNVIRSRYRYSIIDCPATLDQ